jgi:hypothetical protein
MIGVVSEELVARARCALRSGDAFGNEQNTPIAPVNTPSTLQENPQFRPRIDWIPRNVLELEADGTFGKSS